MSLDFASLKAIPIASVVGRYGVQLRYRGEWGSALCPLPSHKKGEKEKTFSINTHLNYFKCFSASCNEQAGCKGGDTINFVALMDGTSQLTVAKKLADWFGVADAGAQTKTASHIEKPSSETNLQKTTEKPSTSGENLKYMQEVEAWFYALIVRGDQESDEQYWGRILKNFKTRLVESYRSGQRSKAA